MKGNHLFADPFRYEWVLDFTQQMYPASWEWRQDWNIIFCNLSTHDRPQPSTAVLKRVFFESKLLILFLAKWARVEILGKKQFDLYVWECLCLIEMSISLFHSVVVVASCSSFFISISNAPVIMEGPSNSVSFFLFPSPPHHVCCSLYFSAILWTTVESAEARL